MKILAAIAIIPAMLLATTAAADTTKARCDVYPLGSDNISKMVPCTFSQRQGYVTISRDDGVTHELSPLGDKAGNFRDQHGHAAYRQSGLGDQGQIFRFNTQSVYIYWNTSALELQSDEDNATAPFTTRDYDATALLRCRDSSEEEFASCPAGILRMGGGQASIVVQNLRGEQFTINFMTGYINATNREVEARLDGDTWIVTIDNDEIYEVPLAAVEGG
jgi:hypothetical protein